MAKDFVAEIVAERTRKNPEFPGLVAEAEARRMGTAASVVSKLEEGGDVKLSTLQRYFAAIGEKFAVAV